MTSLNSRLDSQSGATIIIVLWICAGLVALILYFCNAVNSEVQAAANQVGDIEARQAAAGAIRYSAYVLNNYGINGVVPDTGIAPDPAQDYYSSAVPVGDQPRDSQFWYIGRDPNNPQNATTGATNTQPVFGLVDECSKLNLNTVTANMLAQLPIDAPDLTTDFESAVVSWRTRQPQNGGGAANNLYSTLDPARFNKGAPFESTDELRLVYGAYLDVLLGEDTNRNGALDPNEDDGDATPPHDNQDGQLQPGVLEFVTAFSSQPITAPTSTGLPKRVNITTPQTRGALPESMMAKGVSPEAAGEYMRNLGQQTCTSVADFFIKSRMPASDFAKIHTSITADATPTGRVNVNTAGAEVLACIPGIGVNGAANIVNYRLANPQALTSFAWLPQVIGNGAFQRVAGPYITDQSYQFSADIAAVGRNGRGYCREKVVFDTSGPTPRIIYRQDLTGFGWALGTDVRQSLRDGATIK